MADWYERRDELEAGQVFKTREGQIVKLDRPGWDEPRWVVADWWNGWAYMGDTIHPGALVERLPDDYAPSDEKKDV